jgi:hypothetical protein
LALWAAITLVFSRKFAAMGFPCASIAWIRAVFLACSVFRASFHDWPPACCQRKQIWITAKSGNQDTKLARILELLRVFADDILSPP